MALFHPASRRWADRHFVLTKSGFLHWFTSAEELEPLDALALHRCEFESSSEDATITISEVQGSGVAHVRSSLQGIDKHIELVRAARNTVADRVPVTTCFPRTLLMHVAAGLRIKTGHIGG